MVSYHGLLTPQQRADCKGGFRSFINSSRASLIVFRSIYDYYYELKVIEYNSEEYHQKRS